MSMTTELVHYTTNCGRKAAFVQEGHKWITVLTMDNGLTVRKVPKYERKFMQPIARKGAPYVLSRAVRHFKAFGKAHGSSKSAQAILGAAV